MHHSTSHSPSWRWWISVLLLMATMINYMDRQTLANLSVRITDQFKLNQEQYGDLEFAFGACFALGAICFGAIADRVSVRWLYPCVLIAWSTMGFVTGLTQGYSTLLVCRALLGFFEAGHWPCAMIVMQSIMNRGDRVMGNSILQSGASLGAIATPLIIRLLVGDNTAADAWRPPFLIVGAVGTLWALAWLAVVRRGDFLPDPNRRRESGRLFNLAWILEFVRDPRFWALAIVTISMNTCWQLIRAWLPRFLQQGRGYTEAEALYFNFAYYLATDVGCMLSGAIALAMVRRGVSPHDAKLRIFGGCASLTALTTLAAMLPHGAPLLVVLLIVGAGSLGLFPCYYSFVQEFSFGHVGKASGVLSFVAWMSTAPLQKLFGIYVDKYHHFDLPLALVGWAPMLGLLAMLLLWRRANESAAR